MSANLDLDSGLAGLYRTRRGNLRVGGIASVLCRALTHHCRTDDELWFGPGPLPAADEVVARRGDGLGVHLYPKSVRYLWLDRTRQHLR